MKRTLLYLLVAILSVVGCTKNTPEFYEEELNDCLQELFWDQTEVPEYKVESLGTITYEELAERYFGLDADLDGEVLEAKKEYLKECEEYMKENPDNGKKCYIFYYQSCCHDGTPRTLSGWMAFDKNPENVFFCCPYTHTLEKECASEDHGGYEYLTFFQNGLFIMPDGEGFGKDKNHVQSYLNHKLHAQQYYDALLTALAILSEEGQELDWNWKLRIFGASQGAGDAIALHRFLDTTYDRIDLNPLYNSGKREEAKELCKRYGYPKGSRIIDVPLCKVHNFEYSYVCCGPYCPEVTMQTFREWKKIDYPCVIPLVIKSMRACNTTLANTYPEEAFFSGKWNKIRNIIDGIYLNKTMKSDELNEYICRLLDIPRYETPGPTVPLKDMLSDAMLETNSPIYKALMECLREQDLTTGWKPKTPTKLHYCEDDNVVPYANTQRLIQLFESSNCPYKTVKYTAKSDIKVTAHVDCCEDYITSKWVW